MTREVHVDKPSEAAVNAAAALNALLCAIARCAASGSDDGYALKYADAFIALAKWSGMRPAMTEAEVTAAAMRAELLAVESMGAVLRQRPAPSSGTPSPVPEEDIERVIAEHRRQGLPRDIIDDAIGQAHAAEIARLNERIAELSASRDHWMLCYKDAVERGRQIEKRLDEAERAARERDARLDAELERRSKAAHAKYIELANERDSLRHLADSLTRRLDKQSELIERLHDRAAQPSEPRL